MNFLEVSQMSEETPAAIEAPLSGWDFPPQIFSELGVKERAPYYLPV